MDDGVAYLPTKHEPLGSGYYFGKQGYYYAHNHFKGTLGGHWASDSAHWGYMPPWRDDSCINSSTTVPFARGFTQGSFASYVVQG